jgi:hypothetical protein
MIEWEARAVTLTLPFSLRERPGSVVVDVAASIGAGSVGLDLLDESVSPDSGAGLPVCTATVRYDAAGYGAMMGWIQLVQCRDSPMPADFELDPLALLRDVNTPYAFFGLRPTLFDAPYREVDVDLTWRARAYLAVTPDAVMTRQALPIAAFSWGFDVRGGRVAVVGPSPLELSSWSSHVPLLERQHPGWRFSGPTGA